jgi:hypothetical protein
VSPALDVHPSAVGLGDNLLPAGYLPPLEYAEVYEALVCAPLVTRKSDGKEVRWTEILLEVERHCFAPRFCANPILQHALLESLYSAVKETPNECELCLRYSILERGGFCQRLTNAMLTGQLGGPDPFIMACRVLGEVKLLVGHSVMRSSGLARGLAAPQTFQAAVDSFWKRAHTMLTATMRGLNAVVSINPSPELFKYGNAVNAVCKHLLHFCAIAYAERIAKLHEALTDSESLEVIAACITIGQAAPGMDWPITHAVDLLCAIHASTNLRVRWLADLGEVRLVMESAVRQLHLLPVVVPDAKVSAASATLKLLSLLPASQPDTINHVVGKAVRIIVANHHLGASRSELMREAFDTLAALIATSETATGNEAVEAANRAGASAPQFKVIAAQSDSSNAVLVMSKLKVQHDAAVAAADAAMAALLMEEDGERSAAAKPRKSKKKSKPQASSASAAPEPALPAAVAAASPASVPPAVTPLPAPAPPPAAAAPLPPAAPAPLPASMPPAAAQPPPRAPPPAAAAAAPLLPAPAAIAALPPPSAAAAAPPLPAYLMAPRAAAAAPREPPAAPHAAPLPPLPAAAPPALPPPAPVVATKECCVCLDDVAAADLHLLFPCGHRCVCEACAATVMAADPAARRCPKCRAAVTSTVRVFEE